MRYYASDEKCTVLVSKCIQNYLTVGLRILTHLEAETVH